MAIATSPSTKDDADRERQYGECDAAMVAAHASGGYTYQQIGPHFGVHFTTVAKVVRRAKGRV